MKTVNIAIDGPGGAGKSSISRTVANELGFIHADTGALYRAIGLYAVRNDCLEAEKIEQEITRIHVELKFIGGVQRVLLCGEDVTDYIRSPEVTMAASKVSAVPAVRALLLDLQKKIAAENNVIMDGRDIGTNVLKDAEYKIFLTASAEERARRRFKDLLTRARAGMVICIPEGNKNKTPNGFFEDTTRLPEYYDETYNYLKNIGIKEI